MSDVVYRPLDDGGDRMARLLSDKDDREHPLEGFHDAFPKEEQDSLTVKEAAEHVAARRWDPVAAAHLPDGVDTIASPSLDGRATFKQSDLRKLAVDHEDYRQSRAAWLDEAYQADGEGRVPNPALAELRLATEQAREFADLTPEQLDRLRVDEPLRWRHAMFALQRLQAARQDQAGLAAHLAETEQAGAREFSDIKTRDDVDRLAREDPERHARYERLQREWLENFSHLNNQGGEPQQPQPQQESAEQQQARVQAEHNARVQAEQVRLWEQQTHAALVQQQQQIATSAQQIEAAALTEFPELRSVDARVLAAQLAQTDPARAARLQAYGQATRELIGAAQQWQGQATAFQANSAVAQQQHFESWGREQDLAFVEAHPELQSREAMWRASRNLDAALRARGFQDAQINQIRNDPSARSALGQEALLALAEKYGAQKAMREINNKRKPLPPVQRPGIAHDRNSAAEHEIRSLSERLSQSGSLRDAAKLLVAQRRARR